MIDRRKRTREAVERARQLAARPQQTPAHILRARPARAPSTSADRAVTLTINTIAAGGDGVGRVDGMAVFIPRTAPGDVVDATVVTHRRFARGRVDRIVTSSPVRVLPLCQHYDRDDCGGCQLQHVSASAQLLAKAQIVRDTISRIGKREIPLPDIEPSPRAWDYRQKLTLSLVRNEVTDAWMGGLHRLNEPTQIFELEECRISSPSLVATWHAVRAVSHLLPNGNALRLTLREADDATHVAITVTGGSAWPSATPFVHAISTLAALWWISDSGERVELVSPDNSSGNTAANFVQANASLAPALHQHVLREVRAFRPESVVDAYAGTGALSLDLAQEGVAVTAIEWDASAAAFMRAHLPASSTVLEAPVEGVIDRALYQPSVPQVVVLNPPRVGTHPDVTSALDAQVRSGVRAIVYVSCDPATLARDLTRLPNWRILSVRCFDMFPQTAHVETVCVLIPESL
jgi:23S rRNA (uracil1939-C5)-methyltransferase